MNEILASIAGVSELVPPFALQPVAKGTWDTVTYFRINGLSMILCLRSPLHPLSKLLAIQDHTQNWRNNFEWEGGGTTVGSLSNDDTDGNENGKKAIGLISKTTSFHVHFFVHFFAVVAWLQRENA